MIQHEYAIGLLLCVLIAALFITTTIAPIAPRASFSGSFCPPGNLLNASQVRSRIWLWIGFNSTQSESSLLILVGSFKSTAWFAPRYQALKVTAVNSHLYEGDSGYFNEIS